MSEALVPAAAEPVVVADGEADIVLPALIVDAGPDAVARFLEFFADPPYALCGLGSRNPRHLTTSRSHRFDSQSLHPAGP